LQVLSVARVTTEFGYTFSQEIEDVAEILDGESFGEVFALSALAVEIPAVANLRRIFPQRNSQSTSQLEHQREDGLMTMDMLM
jgi:hypothetical protein